jgi:hypothetical protein
MNPSEKIVQKIPKAVLDKGAKVGEFINLCDVRLIFQEARLGNLKPCPAVATVGHGCKAARHAEQGQIHVEANFHFELRDQNLGAQADPMVLIRAVFTLSYHVSNLENISDDEINAFGTTSGSVSSWPYWRELLSSTMGRMGLPPMTLPSYRIAAESEAVIEPNDSPQPG